MTAQQVNSVVSAFQIQELVLDLVLESIVIIIMSPAHQVNIVVILVEIILANVLDLVLVNRVNLIPTVVQVNIVVVLMEHVPQNVLENFVLVVVTAHQVNIVVVVINVP